MGDRPIQPTDVTHRRIPRRRKRRVEPHGRASIPLILALILGGLALALMRADLAAVGNLNLPGPVFIPPPDPAPVVVTPRRRVLAVLIDGLRADVALRMPFLGELARSGAYADMWDDMPTYSAAQWVAMLTGVRPADSGIRGNMGLLRTPLDSVPRELKAAGRLPAVQSSDVGWWLRLFGDDWVSSDTTVRGTQVVERARARMADADLLWVHLTEVDGEGHRTGVGPEYIEAARGDDQELRRLALLWGWPDATVVVLSDHGHSYPGGGHGGDELEVRRAFFVAAGPGVRARARAVARTVDAAPTLSALLGVAAPAQAEGRTLIELLDAPPPAKVALATGDVVRQARVAAAVTVGRRGLAGVERDERLVRAIAVLACALLAAVFVKRTRPVARLGLLVGAASLVVTAALYLVAFERISFSADRDATVLVYNTIYFGFAACALTFAAPLVAIVTRRLTVSEGSAMAFLAVVGASPAAVAMFVLCGAFQWRFTCEPAWLAVGPLLAYGAMIPPAIFAALMSATAAAVALLPQRRRARATVAMPAPVAAPASARPSAPPRASRA